MRNQDDGFTLIEVLLAVVVTAMAMVAVTGAFLGTLRARTEIQSLSESTVAGQRILTLLERDLRGLWHHNVRRNRVLLGRNRDIQGYDADRIDFLTTTDSVSGAVDTADRINHPTICEVGYWIKENQKIPGLLELWRREDPLIDDDLITQGRFQLVCDRLKDFNISYYETLGAEAEELFEWDSARDQSLPRRMKIEFRVHRKVGNRATAEIEDNEQTVKRYTRHFVFDRRYVDILKAGVAMKPVAPPRPEQAAGGGGGGGADGGSSGAATEQTVSSGGLSADAGRGAGFEGQGRTSITTTGDRGGRPPGGGDRPTNPGRPPGGNRPAGIPIDLGDLLRGAGGGGGGPGNIFGGLGGR